MQHFPVFLDINQGACLVVGGGQVAGRKVDLLLRARAEVTVAAPALNRELADLWQERQICFHQDVFSPELLKDKMLVIAASDDRNVNRWVSEQARRFNIPVNVVDDPALCSFIMPALVDRDPLTIAISTAGAAPVLARRLRGQLEQLIPAGYGRLAQLAGQFRERVKQKLPTLSARRRFWEKVFSGPLADQVLSDSNADMRPLFEQQLQTIVEDGEDKGGVYLIGTGPGDPDLLTLRALQLMQQADILLHDAAINKTIIERARRDAERICIDTYETQSRSRAVFFAELIDLAKQGQRICWLKAGKGDGFGADGFAEASRILTQANIAHQIIPGIALDNHNHCSRASAQNSLRL